VNDCVLEWQNVRKVFVKDGTAVEAVADVSLSIGRGEFVGLVGPSGCGKSTLLSMSAGTMPIDGGRILYHGQPVTTVNRRVGYMTQKDNLLPWRTVKGNVALPLDIKKIPAERKEALVREHIGRVGLAGFENHYPRELSGGMRKRVALIRTLIYDPETLLMDEPFGALDAQLKLIMQDELLRIWSGSGKTIVFVTHDLHEAIALSDRVVVLSRRPGRVKMVADVPLPRPRNVFDLSFSAEAAALHKRLWEALREDILHGVAV
jgi:NitT/TauT family transport system ATP-binding protein